MDNLEIGAAVRVKSLGVIFESETSKGTATFSAGRGHRFIVLLLGSEADSETKDPKELLRELGWEEKQ